MRIAALEFGHFDSEKVKSFLERAPRTQIVRREAVAGKIHVISSIEQALKAFAQRTNVCRSEELEFLVRLSGQRQISRALAACEPARQSVFVCWGKDTLPRLKKEFDVRQVPLREAPEAELKACLERTATFWFL